MCEVCGNPIKRHAKRFCSHTCRAKNTTNSLRELFLKGVFTGDPQILRRFLIEHIGYSCKECGLLSWNNKTITLQVEHIDGNSDNNSLENITLLCPNCHSQTATYGSKNRGNGRSKRREVYKCLGYC